jgi:hypothetical protein
MATHCQSVNSLEEYFSKASREKEELELKLVKAVDLQNQLEELKSSEDFLAQENIDKLREETTAKERRLERSVALNQQMVRAEELITSHKNSGDFLKPKKEQQIQNRIQFKKSVIEKAAALQGEIAQTENNPELLSDVLLKSMNERLELLNNVLKKIQIQDQIPEDARKELQCAGCSRTPEIGTPVFSCLEHHLLCSDCVKNNLKFCLICNQNFLQIPVTRNSLAERMITTLKR